jgi:L-arabinokinase
MPTDLVLYVSGHGFGHATRCAALLVALRALAPDLRVHVRTDAPAWIFRERDAEVAVSEAALDPGVVQSTGLDVDAAATFEAHRVFQERWSGLVESEARWLRSVDARLVVSDAPPLALEAASHAGVPSRVVANFTWDWIFDQWAADDPRWRPVAARYRAAYARAGRAYRLPFHGDFSAFSDVVDVPLLVHCSQRTRAECREALAPEDGRRWVLVSFGGFGSGPVSGLSAADTDGYRFVALDLEAPPGFDGEWVTVRRPSPVAHEDLMNACDAVIGKAGFSTIAEAMAHRTRFLYLPRSNFPEVPILEEGLLAWGGAQPMSRADFEAGRWRPDLDAIFAAEKPPEVAPCNGAELIARSLLEQA